MTKEPLTYEPIHGVTLDKFLRDGDQLDTDYGRPLMRLSVLEEGKHFVWAISHVLYDGWSLPLVFNDFVEAWKASSDALSTGPGHFVSPRPGFKNFIKYLVKARKTKLDAAVEFWRSEILEGEEECVQFPQIHGNGGGDIPTTSAVHSASVMVPWPHPSRRHSGTQLHEPRLSSLPVLSSTYLWAAWAMVLWKHTQSSSVIFGATLNGRRCPVAGIEEITGPTMNTVPVKVRMDREMAVGEFLQHLQRKANSCAEHGWLGVQDILSICGRDTGRMNSVMVVQPASSKEDGQGDMFDAILWPTGLVFDDTRSSAIQHNIGMCLICTPSDTGLSINLQYDPNIKTKTEITWIVGQFTTALKQLVRDAVKASPLGHIRLSSDEEAEQIHRWNSSPTEPVELCLHDLFEAQARATGNAEAIYSAEGSVTYAELDAHSRDLARFLRERDLGPKSMVPVAFENSWLAVVAIIAVLRAGACYVPIDPSTPRERLALILKQVDAKILICSESSSDHIKSAGGQAPGVEMLELSAFTFSNILTLYKSRADIILPRASPSSLAYTIFTSGSTGVPKGVCMSHRASSTGNTAYARKLSLAPRSRVLQFASLSFDVSCLEIFATLLSGGCICIPSVQDRLEKLHSAVQKLRCNVLVLTPTVAKLLQADFVKDPIPVDTLCLTGEPLTASDVEFWAPRTSLLNGYGPTETCFCTFSRPLSTDSSAANIGYGSGSITWIVDESGTELAPLGIKGELFIQGPIVANGYLDDPEKSKASFIESPAWLPKGWNDKGTKFAAYKTGDLARYNPDGSVECFGRKDSQIKTRGMRVDLGEVEQAVSSLGHKAVVLVPTQGLVAGKITAVVAFGRPDGAKNLDELPDPEPGSSVTLQLLTLRHHISSLIPPYMHPTAWIPTYSLPILPSAKVSRGAVKSFVARQLQDSWLTAWAAMLNAVDLRNSTIQPEETMAIEVAEIVDKLIGTGGGHRIVRGCGPYHDVVLSRAGLDSIKTVQLMRLLSERYKVSLTMARMSGGEISIRDLAKYVEHLRTCPDGREDVPLQGVDLVDEYRQLTAVLEDHVTTKGGTHVPFKLADTISTVFMTGAAGYLGIEILHQLVQRPDVSNVIVLIRAEGLEQGLERLAAVAERMGWDLTPYRPKIEVWLGDLSSPTLGLNSQQWERLHGHRLSHDLIDAIIHVGAVVNWSHNYNQLKAVNVSSTLTLLNACTESLKRNGLKLRFIQISGGREPTSSFATPTWEIEGLQLAHELSAQGTLGYTQTKFLSDLLVYKWACLHDGLEDASARVVMPGYIMGGAPRAVAHTDDVLWRMVSTNVRLGMYSSSQAAQDGWVYLASAAVVARRVLGCLFSDATRAAQSRSLAAVDGKGSTRGVTVPILDGLPEGAFWEQVAQSGYPLRATPRGTWLAAVEAAVEAEDVRHPLYPVLHIFKQGVGLGGTLSARDGHEEHDAEMRTEAERDIAANLAFLRTTGFLPTIDSH
jgi:amino acid adenylation domain-containing protein/thioester reductase-like protein